MYAIVLWLIVIVSLIFLIKSSGFFVQSAAQLAKRFGVSEFVVGLTLVAVGASMPELVGMIIASLKGANDLAFGNVLGSNMANIGLSIGLSAMFFSIHIIPWVYQKERILLMTSVLLLLLSVINGMISRNEGILLVAVYFVYIIYVTKFYRVIVRYLHINKWKHIYHRFKAQHVTPQAAVTTIRKWEPAIVKDASILLISGIVLVISADILVDGAIHIAENLHVSNATIGATLIAIGTTAPEISVTIASLRRGYYNILIGSVVGSNIINALFIIGIGSILSPIYLTKGMLMIALPLLGAASIFFVLTLSRRHSVHKSTAITLLLFYVIFLYFMLMQ